MMRKSARRNGRIVLACASSAAIGVVATACGLEVVGMGPADFLDPGPDGSDAMLDGGLGVVRDGDVPVDGPALDPCATDGGGRMVRVDGRFCIDATETTNEQYLPFYLATLSGDAGPLPGQCTWNNNYRPGTWNATSPYFAAAEARVPVHPVDWCDAWMFCQWSGKRLCGSLSGKPVAPADAPDAAASAWTYACSAGATRAYPYSSTYDPNACNTDKGTTAAPVAVGAYPKCVGGYPGIVDMSGNAWEWDDSCEPGNENASCRLRGGSVTRPPDAVMCATALASPRNDATGNNGIRCCKY